MTTRKALRKQLPKGYCKKIAAIAGVTQGAVSKYFSGDLNSESIEMAVLETVAKLRRKKNKLLNQISSNNQISTNEKVA